MNRRGRMTPDRRGVIGCDALISLAQSGLVVINQAPIGGQTPMPILSLEGAPLEWRAPG